MALSKRARKLFLLSENLSWKLDDIPERKREWVHKINRQRLEYGKYHTLFQNVCEYPEKFYEYCRMSKSTFKLILKAIEKKLEKKELNYRRYISPEERLDVLTLRFAMQIPILNESCCGCTLKTGTTIIGIINTVYAGLYVLISSIMAVAVDVVADNPGITPEETDALKVARSVVIVLLVLSAFLFLLGICLTLGAIYENPKLVLPWVICAAVFICLNLILNIVSGSMYISGGDGGQGASSIVVGILYAVIQTYFLLVVYSFYRQISGTVNVYP